MKIVTLSKFLEELVISFDLKDSLVPYSFNGELHLNDLLGQYPDIVLTSFPNNEKDEHPSGLPEKCQKLESFLQNMLGKQVKVKNYFPKSFTDILQMMVQLATDLDVVSQGYRLQNLIEAQIQCWLSSFFMRLRNVKVAVISSINPLKIAGYWIPELVRKTLGNYQIQSAYNSDYTVSWEDISSFRPDVLIIAPRGKTLYESACYLKECEKVSCWELLPATMRGNVYFVDGIDHFYIPSFKILNTAGILVSAMAGLESGYITKRDTFYKMRWVEMNRHKF